MAGEIDLEIPLDEPPLEIAMVAFDDLTLLDLIGPQAVFGMVARTHVVSHDMTPVMGDSGVAIMPTCTFQDVPDRLDVLLLPGGRGAIAAMQNEPLLEFIRDRAPHSRYVTAVCSGSLVLGAAGVLAGYRATTHWAVHDILAEFDGVTPVKERVVIDRDRVTGGGVTAGIDFGLTLLRELRGDRMARLNQLLMEYDPAPPTDAGSPDTAGPELTGFADGLMRGFRESARGVARDAAAKLEKMNARKQA